MGLFTQGERLSDLRGSETLVEDVVWREWKPHFWELSEVLVCYCINLLNFLGRDIVTTPV